MAVGDLVWILDDGPLDTLAAEVNVQSLEAWPVGHLFVAHATAEAAKEDPTGRRAVVLGAMSRGNRGPVIQPFDISVGSTAGEILYSHLRRSVGPTGANLAEHQSIAWALVECPHAIVVTRDKYAAYLALSELGRCRVCHPFEFWQWLKETELLSEAQLQALNERTRRADQSLPGVPWRLR